MHTAYNSGETAPASGAFGGRPGPLRQLGGEQANPLMEIPQP